MSESTAVMATVITDASFQTADGNAGWAGRVICEKQRVTYQGQTTIPRGSSNDAELLAVVETLHRAWEAGVLRVGFGVLIQTDNQHVIHLLNHHYEKQSHKNWPATPPRTSPAQAECLSRLRLLMETLRPDWVFARHVRGHLVKADREARHHVQEAMDRVARGARCKPR